MLRAMRRAWPGRLGSVGRHRAAPATLASVAMANIASQEKRIHRAERERLENRRRTSQVKTWFRRLETAVGAGDAARAERSTAPRLADRQGREVGRPAPQQRRAQEVRAPRAAQPPLPTAFNRHCDISRAPCWVTSPAGWRADRTRRDFLRARRTRPAGRVPPRCPPARSCRGGRRGGQALAHAVAAQHADRPLRDPDDGEPLVRPLLRLDVGRRTRCSTRAPRTRHGAAGGDPPLLDVGSGGSGRAAATRTRATAGTPAARS